MDNTKVDVLHMEVDKILSTAEKIIQRHNELGPQSPLQNRVIADLHSRISHARQKHDDIQKYQRLMDEARMERDHFLGGKDKSVQLTLKAIISILEKEDSDLTKWV